MTDKNGFTVRLLLDTSAVVAFGTNASVGELLAELDPVPDGPPIHFAVTTATLAQSHTAGASMEMLHLLLAHPRGLQVQTFGDWEKFALFLKRVNGKWDNLHDAYLVYMSIVYGAYIVTAAPDTYTEIDAAARTLLLEDPWES